MKTFDSIGISTPDGVDQSKFLVNMYIGINPGEIAGILREYGYPTVVPGGFLKIFTADFNRLVSSLERIENEGLTGAFKNNLDIAYFKPGFIDRVIRCKNAKVPYLETDGSFIKELSDVDMFEAYLKGAQENVQAMEVKSNPEPKAVRNVEESTVGVQGPLEMDEFDKELYNGIVTKLNYMLLAQLGDSNLKEIPNLAELINKVINLLPGVIVSGMYKEHGVDGMMEYILETLGIQRNSLESQRIVNAVSDINVSIGGRK